MTGGCHYPVGCEQYKTICLKCPQLAPDQGLIANVFSEKLTSYRERGSLHIVAPSQWMAGRARQSAILGGRPIHVVRNAVELDVFAPLADRQELRAALGVAPQDLLVLFGSQDLAERRMGVAPLAQALRGLLAEGSLARRLGPGARVHVAALG